MITSEKETPVNTEHPDQLALRLAYESLGKYVDRQTANDVINAMLNKGVVFRMAQWFVEKDTPALRSTLSAEAKPEFIRVDEAARRVGMSERNFTRRIQDGEITAYRDPNDRRWRLVRVSDLGKITAAIEKTYATAQESHGSQADGG